MSSLKRAVDPDTAYEEIFTLMNFVPRTTTTKLGSMILDLGTFTNQGTTIHNYRLRMWIDENTEIPNGESRKYGVTINVYAKQDVMGEPAEQPVSKTNLNIKNVYTYNQEKGSDGFCVTGEEDTCVNLKKAQKVYLPGTIIKYKVNDTLEKYFHVLSDNGETLTLQQRENTVYQIEWYAGTNNNTKGSLTILPILEDATKGWTNVLDQTYSLGTTVFKDNAFTGCSYDGTNKVYNCTTNVYTLEQRISKASMISVQEAHSLGCTQDNQSCPVWVYNYLYDATSNRGTVNQSGGDYGANYGYWTMNGRSSDSTIAWRVYFCGVLTDARTNYNLGGVRAVVVIEK